MSARPNMSRHSLLTEAFRARNLALAFQGLCCLEVCSRDACHLTLRPFGDADTTIEKGDRHATHNTA
jgi:hypothetical protein